MRGILQWPQNKARLIPINSTQAIVYFYIFPKDNSNVMFIKMIAVSLLRRKVV